MESKHLCQLSGKAPGVGRSVSCVEHNALAKGKEARELPGLSGEVQPCGPRQAAFTLFQSSHPRKENNIYMPTPPGCWEVAMNVCTVLQT